MALRGKPTVIYETNTLKPDYWRADYPMIISAFTFVYVFVPNTRVRLGAALIGALVAGVLWQSIGWGFASFVVNSQITFPLLMLGGAYLCFEGAEKLAHRFLHPGEKEQHEAELSGQLVQAAKLASVGELAAGVYNEHTIVFTGRNPPIPFEEVGEVAQPFVPEQAVPRVVVDQMDIQIPIVIEIEPEGGRRFPPVVERF